jgi:nucleotidyltransferase substrate binding protein (TIGR01987 family)
MAGLDLSSLSKALRSLQRAVDRSIVDTSDEEVRDAVIQRFEYSYELCWKMLKRTIERESPVPAEVDRMSFRELVREGGERGIIAHVERWMEYRSQRNITSHIYNESKALSVYQTALRFLPDALSLLTELQSRNR